MNESKSPFYCWSIAETFQRLETDHRGLSEREVIKRLSHFGKNLIEEEKISIFLIFFRQFQSLIIYILFAASIICILIGEWADFLVINFIILMNGLIGFWQEFKAETSIQALKQITANQSKVIREGHLTIIPSSELVPGDFIVLHEGAVITADIRLTESFGLTVDESLLTGESIPVIKDYQAVLIKDLPPYEWENSLLAGTTILRGSAKGVVIKTGKSTYLASIAEQLEKEPPKTPLIKAIDFFTKRYLFILVVIFGSLAVFGLLQGRPPLDLGYILLASLVSCVPAGLPIVITLVMVIGALKLSKQQTLIRYLPSVETLGSVTVIASDKTGTITQGELIVQKVFALDMVKLQQAAALCNDSHEGVGDSLDVALSKWVDEFHQIREKFPRKWTYSFDAKLMLMATVHSIEGKDVLFIKGAFEVLKEKALNINDLPKIQEALHSFLTQGLRVIAFGVGSWENNDLAQSKIELLGLIGFMDPPKAGVQETIQSAKQAGIRVMMITGDHPMTAEAIAEQVDIYDDQKKVLTGKQINSLSDDELLKIIQQVRVCARILPEQKYRIIKLLQKKQEIVAVTGDGVNDILALQSADIGIAMGSGTEATKNVSKMIITDNNLKVIVQAIKNARVIADNIRKVIYYLNSTSLQELCLIALAIFNGMPLPLNAIQILWVNIVTDGVQDKLFAFAQEESDVMQRKPRKPEKQFFDLGQILRLAIFGLAVGGICFGLYVYLTPLYSREIVSTILFTSVVVAQWANGIQAQKEIEPFFKNISRSFSINPSIFLGCSVGILLQLIVIYLFPKPFHSVPMSLEHWVYPIGVFCSAFIVVEMRKWCEYLISLINWHNYYKRNARSKKERA